MDQITLHVIVMRLLLIHNEAQNCRFRENEKTKPATESTSISKLTDEMIHNKQASGNNGDTLAAVILLEGDKLLYVPLEFSAKIKTRSLIDTGTCAIAIPESLCKEILLNDEIEKRRIPNSQFKIVRMTSGKSLQVIGEIALKFRIHDFEFEENFLILPKMNCIISGSPFFFTKYQVGIFPGEKLLKVPELTLQVNKINKKRLPSENPLKCEIFSQNRS